MANDLRCPRCGKDSITWGLSGQNAGDTGYAKCARGDYDRRQKICGWHGQVIRMADGSVLIVDSAKPDVPDPDPSNGAEIEDYQALVGDPGDRW